MGGRAPDWIYNLVRVNVGTAREVELFHVNDVIDLAASKARAMPSDIGMWEQVGKSCWGKHKHI